MNMWECLAFGPLAIVFLAVLVNRNERITELQGDLRNVLEANYQLKRENEKLCQRQEIAYLIERNDRMPEDYGAYHCEWLTTSRDEFLLKTVFDWTTDANKAIKFADFDSARLVDRTLDACYKITEHVWVKEQG